MGRCSVLFLLQMLSKTENIPTKVLLSAAAGLLAMGCQTTGRNQPPPEWEEVVIELPPCPPTELAAATEPRHPSYETAPVFAASALLHRELLGGPNHEIREDVINDGLVHHFCIDSDFGTFHGAGRDEAVVRVHEVYAIAALQDLSNAGAFGRGAGDSAVSLVTSPFRGIARILRNPLHILAVIPAPVAAVAGAVRSTQQLIEMGFTPEYARTVVGYYRARRNLAARYGVSAESDNPVLNASLDAVAWEFYAGGLPLDVVERFVPTPGVPRVQAFEGARGSAAPIADAAADRLLARDANTRMRRMGVERDARRAFNQHPAYDRGLRGGIVGALWEMEEVENRVEVIDEALAAPDRHAARAKRHEFEMLAAYHERVAPLTEITTVWPFAAARRLDGALIIAVYCDHAAWTESTAQRFYEMRDCLLPVGDPAGAGIPSDTEVWLAGSASPAATARIAALGWTPYPEALLLLADPYDDDASEVAGPPLDPVTAGAE
jgi:hypothetical protein